MKKLLLLLVGVGLLAACSSPKYSYYFDHYDYNSGKPAVAQTDAQLAPIQLRTPDMSPLQLDPEAMTASMASRIIPVEKVPVVTNDASVAEKRELLSEKYSSLTKSEKKEFRKELKREVKEIIKAKKKGEDIKSIMEQKAMDQDLKMALIFGVVGLVLSAFGGVNSVFWILGVVSVVIAIVFLIKWIAEQ